MKETSCPNCGYPDTKNGQHFKGIHDPYLNCPHCNYLVTPTVEKTKKFVEEKLREQLKDFVGMVPTEESRQKMEDAFQKVLKDFSNTGLIPTFEVTVKQEGDRTVLVGTFQPFTRKGDIVGEDHGMTGTIVTPDNPSPYTMKCKTCENRTKTGICAGCALKVAFDEEDKKP